MRVQKIFQEGSESLERDMGLRIIHLSKSLSVETYIRLMKRTSCLVGNSSSGIREGAFIGTPVVNIGTRQDRRQRGSNVIDVGYDREEIKLAILWQLGNGKYPPSRFMGTGMPVPKSRTSLWIVHCMRKNRSHINSFTLEENEWKSWGSTSEGGLKIDTAEKPG